MGVSPVTILLLKHELYTMKFWTELIMCSVYCPRGLFEKGMHLHLSETKSLF